MTTRAVPNRAMKEALRFLYPALMRLAAVFAKDRNGQKKKTAEEIRKDFDSYCMGIIESAVPKDNVYVEELSYQVKTISKEKVKLDDFQNSKYVGSVFKKKLPFLSINK